MKGKIKNKKKILLLASGIILFMLVLAVICWHWLTPVQIGSRYSLEELEENQAVLVVKSITDDDIIVVDRKGGWKHYDSGKVGRWWLAQFNNDLYYGRITQADVDDEILKNKDIPYGKGRVSRFLLDWAINIEAEDVEKVQEEYYRVLESTLPWSRGPFFAPPRVYRYYAIIGTGEPREEVLIETLGSSLVYPGEESLTCYTGDIRLRMMRRKLEKLQKKCDMYFD